MPLNKEAKPKNTLKMYILISSGFNRNTSRHLFAARKMAMVAPSNGHFTSFFLNAISQEQYDSDRTWNEHVKFSV